MSLIGSTISHYSIVEQLGFGGMGVVYRGRDSRLGRDVALKFLPPELVSDEESNERFMQEARAASALNHPNVCPVYDIGETADGMLYIVMPLYDGQTLKYRMRSESASSQGIQSGLSHENAIRILKQVATGLGAAHQKGIVHRDVKPDNIMITDDGQVIILDFGLAKLAGGLAMTKTGSTVGTAYYMSPEQIMGEEVDGRSDLWSLGVVMYQLLTGKRPFEGDFEPAVTYSILHQEPEFGLVPETLRPVLKKLLAKDRDYRYATADELIAALSPISPERGAVPPPSQTERERKSFLLGRRTVVGVAVFLALVTAVALLRPWEPGLSEEKSLEASTASSQVMAPKRHSIAVLPFTNLRSDPETDFLGYATADQVIGSLSYVKNLNVRPSSSIREYEGRTVNAQEVGSALDVDYVVAGNYLRQADKMRLTVEMVDVKSNEIVWKEPIEVSSTDVFAIQDRVSQTVLNRLNVTFSQQERDRMQADVSSSPLAYEYYLRALSQPRTDEGNQLAMDLLDQSISLDSLYAPAWSELGFRRRSQALYGLAGPEMYVLAEEAFDRALGLNPNLIAALADLSTARNESGLSDEAYEMAERAIRLNPNNAVAHFARGYVLRYTGMIDESVAEMRTAIELDPKNLRFRSCGLTFMLAGLYEEARRAFAIDGESAYPIWTTGVSYILEGRTDEALEVLTQMKDFNEGGLPGAVGRAFLAYLSGDYEEGLRQAHIIEDAALTDGESDYWVATHYCTNGDNEGCIRNFRKAVENGFYPVSDLRKTPFLDSIRGTDEYDQIIWLAQRKHDRFKAKYFGG